MIFISRFVFRLLCYRRYKNIFFFNWLLMFSFVFFIIRTIINYRYFFFYPVIEDRCARFMPCYRHVVRFIICHHSESGVTAINFMLNWPSSRTSVQQGSCGSSNIPEPQVAKTCYRILIYHGCRSVTKSVAFFYHIKIVVLCFLKTK